MDFTIYTYGDVSALYGMLNGVVMIMGDDVYKTMIRMMLGFGAMTMILYMMHAGVHAHRGWKWLVTVALMSSILFTPKANVIIEDATGHSSPAVVANVPYALAFLFGTKSGFGHDLTVMGEAGFQTIPSGVSGAPDFVLPSELSYLQNGMMFGARLVDASRSANIPDAVLRTDLTNYVKDCVIPSVGHLISMDDLMKSTNLWGLFANTNNALFASYWDSGEYKYATCPTVYAILDLKIAAATNDVLTRIGTMVFPQAKDAAAANALLQPGLVAAYSKANIAAASADANAIILQNALINVMSDASAAMATQMGDSAAVLQAFARQQGTVQVNSSLIAEGESVSASLAILKNILDVILIAAFPIVALLLIATEGEGLRSLGIKYILALVCIEAWPFMNAAVSFVGNTYAAHRMAMAGALPGGGSGMALINADAIYSGAISDLAMVGMAMKFVPVICFGLFFGMDKAVSAMASGASGMAATIGRKTAEAMTGTVSGGSASFDNYSLAMQKTDANMVRMDNVAGSTYFDARNPFNADARRSEARLGSSPVKVSDVFQSTQRWSEMSREQQSLAHGQLDSASSSLNANYQEAIAWAQSRGDRTSLDRLTQAGRSDSYALSSAQQDRLVDSLAQNLGISVTEANRRELRSAVDASLDASVSSPAKGFFGGVSASVRTSLSHAGSRANSEQIDNALRRTTDQARTMSLENRAATLESVVQQKGFAEGDTESKELSKRISSDVSRARGYVKSADVALRSSQEYAQAAESAKSATQQIGFDFVREYNAYAWSSLGKDPNDMSAAEHAATIKSFFLNRTQLAQDDKGSFLALREFNDVSDYLAGGGHLRSADAFGDGRLDQQFTKDRTQNLATQTAITPGNASAATVRGSGAGNRAAVGGAAGAGGVDMAAPLERPTDLAPLEGQATRDAAEIQRDALAGSGSVKAKNEDEKARLDGLMDRGLKNAPTDGFSSGPNDIAKIDRTHRPMPDVKPPAPPAPSAVDLIPKGPVPDRSAVDRIPK